jgi:hypothetical protein|mmetsp:Transcript_92153/g.145730  ORF Transcript_92153/g.145730 Transcript_92153/m.145730 type:complete len:514 (+) Transcript_92153:69-1610(+)|eukprot:CAMPEP_0169098294 /NCGR_PEP_ID=MMETSP1015-20121227/19967_1 /TAXON_ID=342587 /ORGANISM="Karlodinium micrum, Strain CCMP2283" /LENGTH=513 /DNA_ID=CAMNT_0009159139 /DNA_START=72 /DNA_END=1613 /DNA_ORIENTATION=-
MATHQASLVIAVFAFSLPCASGFRQKGIAVHSHASEGGGLSKCKVNGPEAAGLRWHFGTENCKMRCKQTIFTKGNINDAFAEQFVASREKGRCHCRDKDTKRDRLPPHGVLSRCGKADCWEYYRNVMAKVVALPTTNFWSADQECAPCGGIEQPKCDETHLDKSFGGDDLREMKIQALADTTGNKQKELDVIINALRDEGLEVSERILETTVKDEFRWTTVEPLTCSKHCADENGPGMEVGRYICEKLSSSGSWESVEDDDCLETEGPMPALEVCATNVCRAAWATDTLGNCQEKLNVEVQSSLPEGMKPGWEPSLIDITDLMKEVEAKGLRCCCDKQKTGLAGFKDVLRGIGEDRSKYCKITSESKCGDVVVTESTEKAHSYESTDGKCEILKSTLDELKSQIDVTERELVSGIVEGTWEECDQKCLKNDQSPEDAQQSRSVHCYVETGAGTWERRDVKACETLIPGATKPLEQRTCEIEPPPCFKWVVVTQCQDADGNVMEDSNCNGLSKP